MKKKASELKPGDVLAPVSSFESRVVCSVSASAASDDRVSVHAYDSRTRSLDYYNCHEDELIEVESPSLTRAQQHAEELADAARRLVEKVKPIAESTGLIVANEIVLEILAKIDPPKPPSAEEMLQALVSWERHVGPPTSHVSEVATVFRGLLERARAAGML